MLYRLFLSLPIGNPHHQHIAPFEAPVTGYIFMDHVLLGPCIFKTSQLLLFTLF